MKGWIEGQKERRKKRKIRKRTERERGKEVQNGGKIIFRKKGGRKKE